MKKKKRKKQKTGPGDLRAGSATDHNITSIICTNHTMDCNFTFFF